MKKSRKERLDRIYEDVEMVTDMLHQEGKSIAECSHIEVMAALLLHILDVLGAAVCTMRSKSKSAGEIIKSPQPTAYHEMT